MSGCHPLYPKSQIVPIREQREIREPWGFCTSIDLFNCDPLKIRDADVIRHYVNELCILIDMKRFGETQVVHFGEDEKVAGFSMVQLIETSLISGHFANSANAAYIDIFSCKPYNSERAVNFTRSYFLAAEAKVNYFLRGQ